MKTYKDICRIVIENTGKLMLYLPEFLRVRIISFPYYKIKSKKINSALWFFFKPVLQSLKYPVMVLRKFDDYILSLDLSSHVNRRCFYFYDRRSQESLKILIDGLLTKDDVYIDVGANIGHTTLMASTRVKRVYAFEPVEEMLKHFRRNMGVNNIKNVVLYNLALSNKKGTAKIKVSKVNDGMNTMNEDFAVYGIYEKEVEIKTDIFDNLKIDKATMVKIDVEGHELEVLEGMSKSINKVSYVLCEVSVLTYNSIQSFFKSHGFERIKKYDKGKVILKENKTFDLLFINKKKVLNQERIIKLLSKMGFE